MSRPLRIEYPDAYYHVMNRGRGRQNIFHSSNYYEAFLTTLAEAHQLFDLQIHAYCLMQNHYHLLIKTPLANLSRGMGHINGHYTQRYNRLRWTDGSLFRGRYKSILVDNEHYLLKLTRYIHRNPIAVTDSRISLNDFKWSSYLAYIDRAEAQTWLYREETYQLLGHEEKYIHYKNYVENDNYTDGLDTFYAAKKLSPILGCKGFKESALCKTRGNIGPKELRKKIMEPPSISLIVNTVASTFNTTPETILLTTRGQPNLPRTTAIYLARMLSKQPRRVIAYYFGLNSPSGVSHCLSKLNEKLENDVKLREQIDGLIHRLTP